jgi:hypothetical protein
MEVGTPLSPSLYLLAQYSMPNFGCQLIKVALTRPPFHQLIWTSLVLLFPNFYIVNKWLLVSLKKHEIIVH